MSRRYDGAHRRATAAAVAACEPGAACCRCGHPMWPGADRLELDHTDDGLGYRGLSHSSPCLVCGQRCNQKAGGELAAVRAGKRLRDRRCVVCGMPFRASRGSSGARVETCPSPACKAELRRRIAVSGGIGEPPPPSGRVW